MKVEITKKQKEYLDALTRALIEAQSLQRTAVHAMAPGIDVSRAGIIEEDGAYYLVTVDLDPPETKEK